MRRVLASFLAVLVVAGCTPVVIPAGPATAPPALNDDAIIAADGARLPLRRYPPEGRPRAIILALHGFNDHAGNFLTDSLPRLNEAGLLIYAYDQRGFGRAPNRGYWAGAETLARDAADAARAIRARHPGLPLWMLGESMGAAVAILAGATDAPPVDGYILLTPALWSRDAMNPAMRGGLWLIARTMPILGFQGGVGGVLASDNPAALRRLGRDPLVIRTTRVDAAVGLVDLMDAAVASLPACCQGRNGRAPTLMLIGAQDSVMPNRVSRAALLRVPPEALPRVAAYRDGFHLLLAGLNREVVMRDILAFIATPTAPLPSGADADAPDWLADRLSRDP
jgi:alpha-beta hydrolase superfamily lysophospholipase